MSVLAPMSEAQPVLYEAGDRIARITLNRPERGNGIVPALLRGLVEGVERADLDPSVHVMLLSGNGARLLRRLRPRGQRRADGVLDPGGAGARERLPDRPRSWSRRQPRPLAARGTRWSTTR